MIASRAVAALFSGADSFYVWCERGGPGLDAL
jgi:hypothetical protein